MAKSGCNPDEFALQSLRIGGATTLAAGGNISVRTIRREGRWNAYKAFMRNTTEIRGGCHVGYWWKSKGRKDSWGREQPEAGDDI